MADSNNRTNGSRIGIDQVEPRQGDYTVSLIIPTLNEADNLPLLLPNIPFQWVDEIVLVDGGSTDRTVEIAQEIVPSLKVVVEERSGKGLALRAGYEAASGDILIVMDADGSNDPREIPRFIQPLLEGADFVKGSRFTTLGGTTDMPRLRKWGNGVFVHMVNLLFSVKFTDLAYGYHAFWRHCLDRIDVSDSDGFEIDTALYLRAITNHLRIVEVPSFEGERFYGEGKLKTFPDGWRVLRTIISERIFSFGKNGNLDAKKGFRGIIPYDKTSAAARNRPNTLRGTEVEVTQHLLQMLRSSLHGAPNDPTYRSILPLLMLLVMKSLKANSGSIVLLDENGQPADSFTAHQGKVRSLSPRQISEAVNGGLAGWIMENQQPGIVESTMNDPRWVLKSWEKKQGTDRSALGIPLFDDNRVYGVMIFARESEPFNEESLAILEGLELSEELS